MSKTSQIIVGIVAVVALVVGIGAYVHRPSGIAGAVGDTQSSPKMVQISANMASNTLASFLNIDSTDRYITNVDAVMTAFGSGNNLNLANNTMSLLAATGTTAFSTTSCTSTCAAMNIVTLNAVSTSSLPVMIIGTSTAVAVASSTIPNTNSSSRWWPAGSYLNFYSNATSTAGSADIKVSYISY